MHCDSFHSRANVTRLNTDIHSDQMVHAVTHLLHSGCYGPIRSWFESDTVQYHVESFSRFLMTTGSTRILRECFITHFTFLGGLFVFWTEFFLFFKIGSDIVIYISTSCGAASNNKTFQIKFQSVSFLWNPMLIFYNQEKNWLAVILITMTNRF